MHQQRRGEGGEDARHQAIGQVIAAPRHRQQARGLVDHEDLVVGMEDVERQIGWPVIEGRVGVGLRQWPGFDVSKAAFWSSVASVWCFAFQSS